MLVRAGTWRAARTGAGALPLATATRACALGLPLVLAALAGCSDDGGKPGTIKSLPTATSSSPTATTPEQQIEEAVRTYYAELTHAAQTLDTSKLRTLSTKGCPCYGVVKGIDEVRRKGKSTPDAAWEVKSIRVHDIEGQSGVADVKYRVSAYEVLDQNGDIERRFPEDRDRVDLSMVRADSGWIIGNLFDLNGP